MPSPRVHNSEFKSHNVRSRQLGKAAPWVVAAAVVLAGGGLWWWKSHGAGEGAASTAAPPGGGRGGRFGGGSRVQPVSVEAAQRKDMRVLVSAIGTITASNTAVVQAQVSGVLQNLMFKEGQQVKAGQQLAQIDPRAFQAAVAQAEGQLARDAAQLANAKVDLARYKDLLAKDAIAKQQVDTQEALVRQLNGTAKADQASVDSARLQLSYTRVLAPISGRVGLKQADLGNVVQPGSANGIVSITQTRPVALVFAVPASHLPRISAALHSNKPLVVEAWDRGGATKLAEGRVASTDNAIDPTTDSIKLKALFKNEDEALFPNQAVSVRLSLDLLEGSLVVPSAAVLRGAQGFYVYAVGQDSSVSMRLVKPGVVDDGWTAVEGQLRPGEQVVIDGVDRLRDGAKVEVIAADPAKRKGAEAPPAKGRRGQRGASAPMGGASQSAAGGGEARPPRLDRLPPDQQEAFMKMSPEERKAFIEKRRAARAQQGG